MTRASQDAQFRDIRNKVEGGVRLSAEDGLYLYRDEVPLPEIGELANLVLGSVATKVLAKCSTPVLLIR